MIIEVAARTVDWFALVGDDYEPIDRSGSINCSPAKLAETIEWQKEGGA